MKSKLLQNVDNREESGSIIIDSDSLIYSANYLHRDNWDIELAYMNFCERIAAIRTAMYDKVSKIDDLIICLTSKTNFRYKIYPKYKHNRKSLEGDALLLKERSSQLKKLIYERLKPIVKISTVFEADDLVVQYAYKGYYVSAYDKDVVNACPTEVYNYKKSEWYKAKTSIEIRDWYLVQSIMGDTGDGWNFVKGMGEVKAKEFIVLLDKGVKEFQDYIDLFDTPADCLLANKVCRMNQYDEDGELKLITMQEVIDEILPF